MKTFFIRVARTISCLILPIGSFILTGTLLTSISSPRSSLTQNIGYPIIIGMLLFAIPMAVIFSSQSPNPRTSNKKLAIRLILVGFVPVLLTFAFFTLWFTHD